MKARDFSLEVYNELLTRVINSGCKVIPLKEYLSQKELQETFVILRHDVDRRPENALRMAEMESLLGICSTYYFRLTRNTFRPDIIRRVEALGHEIGYHYEVMDRAKGDMEKAGHIFRSELARLRSVADIHTVCMHGNPFSPWDNRAFWQQYSWTQFELKGEAYLSINDPELYYSTDTGRGGTDPDTT